MRTISCNAWRNRTNAVHGFTLVELLIVISIIGVLVALTMPAVNSAREAGRRAQCSNNLHQMALACLALESKYGHLPGGGWGWMWAGDPDRGYGVAQPGGWHFNILPFIDQADLHDLGKATTAANRRAAGLQRNETPVAIFICPTRHRLQVFPRNHPVHYINIDDPMPRIVGRSDYAANAGSTYTDVSGPNGMGNGPNQGYDPKFDWSQIYGSINSPDEPATGVIFRAGALPTSLIKDGVSNTYMIGERYLCTDAYYVGSYCDNDQGWDQGYDWDSNRGTGHNYRDLASLPTALTEPPYQDRPGLCGCMTNFGSAHGAGFNMAFCDGSVRLINYSIDPIIHMQLGHRSDGEPTDLSKLDAGK